jgi:cell division septum initiation protein DivIVA
VAQVLKANERLRENNDALREEVEELKEMVEILKVRRKAWKLWWGSQSWKMQLAN